MNNKPHIRNLPNITEKVWLSAIPKRSRLQGFHEAYYNRQLTHQLSTDYYLSSFNSCEINQFSNSTPHNKLKCTEVHDICTHIDIYHDTQLHNFLKSKKSHNFLRSNKTRSTSHGGKCKGLISRYISREFTPFHQPLLIEAQSTNSTSRQSLTNMEAHKRH